MFYYFSGISWDFKKLKGFQMSNNSRLFIAEFILLSAELIQKT